LPNPEFFTEFYEMKKTIFFNILAISMGVSISAPAAAETLLEIYQQALQSDPLIHEAEARRLASMELLPQARGLLFPQVTASGSFAKGSSDSKQPFQVPGGGFEFAKLDSDSETLSWRAELRQSVFRWDQFVGMRQAEKQVAKSEINFEAAQQDLIVRVATRYFDVLAAEDRLTSIHADRLAIARQLEQAQQRFEVGLIAITAVQESQAAYDQSVASEIQAKRELATARELLREITGEYVAELSAPDEGFPLAAPVPADEGSWIDMAMDQNLSLISSRFDEEIARDEIAFRRTGHYPTLDLVASYDTAETDTTDQRIDGFL